MMYSRMRRARIRDEHGVEAGAAIVISIYVPCAGQAAWQMRNVGFRPSRRFLLQVHSLDSFYRLPYTPTTTAHGEWREGAAAALKKK